MATRNTQGRFVKSSGGVMDIDLGFGKIVAALGEFEHLNVFAGFQGRDSSAMTQLAFMHEIGTINMPARPFLNSAFVVGEAVMAQAMDAVFNGIIDGKMEALDGAIHLGKVGVDLIKNRILSAPEWAEALALSTVRMKGHDLPLLDTEAMIDAVTYRVLRGDVQVAFG